MNLCYSTYKELKLQEEFEHQPPLAENKKGLSKAKRIMNHNLDHFLLKW
jgi:hypothetical protein